MSFKMKVNHAEHGLLLEHEVHFWTLQYDENNDFAEVLFPDESEYIHAQTLVEVLA